MLTLSTEMEEETSIELVATTEANEAAADQHSTGNRVTQQPEALQTTAPRRHPPLPFLPTPVAGIVASETKQGNVIRNVLSTKTSTHHRSREMAKGAVECECGDPPPPHQTSQTTFSTCMTSQPNRNGS